MIKEFREFFTREIKVTSGNKPDKELNFPISEYADTCKGKQLKFNRLLASHFATDNVIKKFVESITFKLNPEDTASGTEQGLILKGTDEEAVTNHVETSGFTKGLQIHQLPIIVDNNNQPISFDYLDLVTSAVYTSLSAAVASGNPFVLRYKIFNGSKLLYSIAHNPALLYSNNFATVVPTNQILVDSSKYFNSDGSKIILTYKFTTNFTTSDADNLIVKLRDSVLGTTSNVYIYSETEVGLNVISMIITLTKVGSNFEVSVDVVKTSAAAGTSVRLTNVVSYIAIPTNDFYVESLIYTDAATSTISVNNVSYESKIV